MLLCDFGNLLLSIKLFFLSGGTFITPLPITFFIATLPTDVMAPVAKGATILVVNFVAAEVIVLVISNARTPKKHYSEIVS